MKNNNAVKILEKNIKNKIIFNKILKHSILVNKISQRIAKKINYSNNLKHKINLEIINYCAILHDIGRIKYPPYHKYSIKHNIAGEKIIKKEIILKKNILKKSSQNFNKNLNKNNKIKEINKIKKEIKILEICKKVCKTHTAAGFSKKDIIKYKINLPIDNYIPKNIYEKIICYSDKLANGEKEVKINYSIERFENWLGKFYKKRLIKLHDNIIKLLK